MGYRFVKYMKMNTNELDRMLTQQGVPPLRVQEIVETVTEQKKAQRKAKAHKQQMDLQWGEFLAPLIHEHKTVRSISATRVVRNEPMRLKRMRWCWIASKVACTYSCGRKTKPLCSCTLSARIGVIMFLPTFETRCICCSMPYPTKPRPR
jgi:hypothetical protein